MPVSVSLNQNICVSMCVSVCVSICVCVYVRVCVSMCMCECSSNASLQFLSYLICCLVEIYSLLINLTHPFRLNLSLSHLTLTDCNTLTLTHSYQLLHTDTPGDCPCPPHKLSVLMYDLSAPRALLLSFYQLRKIFPQGMHFCRCWKTVKKH